MKIKAKGILCLTFLVQFSSQVAQTWTENGVLKSVWETISPHSASEETQLIVAFKSVEKTFQRLHKVVLHDIDILANATETRRRKRETGEKKERHKVDKNKKKEKEKSEKTSNKSSKNKDSQAESDNSERKLWAEKSKKKKNRIKNRMSTNVNVEVNVDVVGGSSKTDNGTDKKKASGNQDLQETFDMDREHPQFVMKQFQRNLEGTESNSSKNPPEMFDDDDYDEVGSTDNEDTYINENTGGLPLEDILENKSNDTEKGVSSNFKTNLTKSLRSVSDPSKLWPECRVPFKIDEKFSNEDSLIILMEIAEFGRDTGIIWVPKAANDSVFALFNKSEPHCRSFIGKVAKVGEQSISLGEGCVNTATVLQLMLHTVGVFLHSEKNPANFSSKNFPESVTLKPENFSSNHLKELPEEAKEKVSQLYKCQSRFNPIQPLTEATNHLFEKDYDDASVNRPTNKSLQLNEPTCSGKSQVKKRGKSKAWPLHYKKLGTKGKKFRSGKKGASKAKSAPLAH